jgi:hypothetical protein
VNAADWLFLPYRLADVDWPEWTVPALLILATLFAGVR